MASKSNLIAGMYHIVEMEQWDEDYINMEMQGYIQFSTNETGDFHFGCVQAQMDCNFVKRDGSPGVEFTFDGSDEMDPVTGRGWAVLDGKTLKGQLFFHLGDDSGFVAKRVTSAR